jgi:hypothetical protein
LGPRSNKKGKFAPSVKARRLERRKPVLTPGKTILIVCEDSKSSYLYWKKFCRKHCVSSVYVEICGPECGSAPINVIDYAIKQRDSVPTSPVRDDYDDVFCVIDVDRHTTLAQAIDKANTNNLRVILSNPCFEYWYILHFKRTGSPYHSSRDVVSDLKSYFPNYDKGNADIFEEIYPRTDEATERSKEILRSQYHDEEDLRQCNPSTDVHRVVECILDIAEKSRPR